jgi:hypothetical protein
MPASNGEAPQNGTGYAICYKKKLKFYIYF